MDIQTAVTWLRGVFAPAQPGLRQEGQGNIHLNNVNAPVTINYNLVANESNIQELLRQFNIMPPQAEPPDELPERTDR